MPIIKRAKSKQSLRIHAKKQHGQQKIGMYAGIVTPTGHKDLIIGEIDKIKTDKRRKPSKQWMTLRSFRMKKGVQLELRQNITNGHLSFRYIGGVHYGLHVIDRFDALSLITAMTNYVYNTLIPKSISSKKLDALNINYMKWLEHEWKTKRKLAIKKFRSFKAKKIRYGRLKKK